MVPASLGPAIVKADCIRMKPAAAAVEPRCLMYALNSPVLRHQAAAIIHGVGRPRLNQGEIKSLRIPLPPRAEQDRIVAEIEKQLTRLDAGVAALKRLQAHLRRYRAAVLEEATAGLPLVPLQDLLREPLCNGKTVKGSADPPGVPALRLNAMGDSGFDYSRVRYLPLDWDRCGRRRRS